MPQFDLFLYFSIFSLFTFLFILFYLFCLLFLLPFYWNVLYMRLKKKNYNNFLNVLYKIEFCNFFNLNNNFTNYIVNVYNYNIYFNNYFYNIINNIYLNIFKYIKKND